jgi:hypothetical protein
LAPPRQARFEAVVIASLTIAAASAEAATCDAWPGEPAPLPTLDDPDPLRAEWANLRAQELAQVARSFEAEDPLRVLRSQAVRVHRPPLLPEPFDAARGRDPWESLGAPIGMAGGDARQKANLAELRKLRSAVGALEKQVRAARFSEAMAMVPALRKQLAAAPAGSTRNSLIAQAEVLAATAELALGRATGAEASLHRALDANPRLRLDPATTPRKVQRALEVVRESR